MKEDKSVRKQQDEAAKLNDFIREKHRPRIGLQKTCAKQMCKQLDRMVLHNDS